MCDRNLIDLLPWHMREYKELNELLSVTQFETTDIWRNIQNILDDQFILTATKNGIERWEKFLEIRAKASETLDERRIIVLTRINEQRPFTIAVLRDLLDGLCGADAYSLTVYPQNFVLQIRLALPIKLRLDPIREMLERVVPVNIIIDLDLQYNSHSDITKFTHRELSKHMHSQLKDEVLV